MSNNLTLREYRPGEVRDLAGDFAFCVDRVFSLVRIEDPYLLADDGQYRALRRFLDGLAKLWQRWPTKLEIKTRDTGAPDQKRMIADLETALRAHGTALDVRRVVTNGPRRTDFHDRRLIFQPDCNNPRQRVLILLTGGVDRYLDQRFECGVIAHRSF
jgi:hypothetical protein